MGLYVGKVFYCAGNHVGIQEGQRERVDLEIASPPSFWRSCKASRIWGYLGMY